MQTLTKETVHGTSLKELEDQSGKLGLREGILTLLLTRLRKRGSMDEFRDVLEELSLFDIKMEKGWFTWVNNREGNAMVKNRLDRFLISTNDVDNFPFLETRVVRQSKPDHDAIILDTMGHKPHGSFRDPRLFFKYDVCWAKEKDAKNIIKNAWSGNNLDIIKKIEKVGLELG
ncbi:Endonuclease/exonuclease/phosphatase [Gossypium australe]|uniref:Endonuclease/exonuclease/phosphatase n=1 Tax=Gossypium australe TaxID=47621 RepID=A0A5B6WNF2_9ROSI|nr:Endonuclease/exonuclease/phosphatase [Gossypium australe]